MANDLTLELFVQFQDVVNSDRWWEGGRQKILISAIHGLDLRRIERERYEISDEQIVNLWL